MKIQDRRKAIYEAENIIEDALDKLAEMADIRVQGINVQNVWDDDKNQLPAIKVNLVVSKQRDGQ